MPLFEFRCRHCSTTFEQILPSRPSESTPQTGTCPTCGKKSTEKLIPLFRVGGRGDLRESTFHGCHDHDVGPGEHDHHSHSDENPMGDVVKKVAGSKD